MVKNGVNETCVHGTRCLALLMFLAARRFEELMRMQVIYEGAFGEPFVCSAGRHLAQRLFASFHCGIFLFWFLFCVIYVCIGLFVP